MDNIDIDEERARLRKVIEELKTLDYICGVGTGISSTYGLYVLPVIKIGQEDKAVFLPEFMNGIWLNIRFEKDD